jgi:hypothetical protein
MSRHDLPGDTESALDRAMFYKGFLQRMQFHLIMHALGKAFDRDNDLPIRALGGIDT